MRSLAMGFCAFGAMVVLAPNAHGEERRVLSLQNRQIEEVEALLRARPVDLRPLLDSTTFIEAPTPAPLDPDRIPRRGTIPSDPWARAEWIRRNLTPRQRKRVRAQEAVVRLELDNLSCTATHVEWGGVTRLMTAGHCALALASRGTTRATLFSFKANAHEAERVEIIVSGYSLPSAYRACAVTRGATACLAEGERDVAFLDFRIRGFERGPRPFRVGCPSELRETDAASVYGYGATSDKGGTLALPAILERAKLALIDDSASGFRRLFVGVPEDGGVLPPRTRTMDSGAPIISFEVDLSLAAELDGPRGVPVCAVVVGGEAFGVPHTVSSYSIGISLVGLQPEEFETYAL